MFDFIDYALFGLALGVTVFVGISLFCAAMVVIDRVYSWARGE